MRFLFLTLLLLSYAASLWGQEPDWIRGKSKDYPNDQFIVGVGSGDTRQEAEGQARARIGEVFKVEIKSDISINKTEVLKKDNSAVSSESEEKTKSRVYVGLRKTLEGTEIAEVWQDPKNARFFALAVLEREKASARIAQQIQRLDSEIVRLKYEVDSATVKTNKLKLILLRKSLMTNRAELDSDYRVVSASGNGIPSPYSLEKEDSEMMEFLQNDFIIGVTGDGPGSYIVEQTITDRLTSNSLTVERANEKKGRSPDLVVKVVCRLQPSTEPVDDWYYCRWHLELNATDANAGTIVLSASKSGKSGQLSIEESKNRAIYDMNRSVVALANELLKKLTGTE